MLPRRSLSIVAAFAILAAPLIPGLALSQSRNSGLSAVSAALLNASAAPLNSLATLLNSLQIRYLPGALRQQILGGALTQLHSFLQVASLG